VVTVAVVGMGEMGSGVAGRLVERGARVVTSLDGRSAASADRARAAGAEVLGDAEVVREAEVILSIVPPGAARATAARFADLIARLDRRPTYIDCNAVAPQTFLAMAKPFEQLGLPLGDGSIIGLAPRADGYSPKLYLSGPIAGEAATLRGLGLDARIFSERLGDASALKMAFGGFTKGVQALATVMALGAARHGVADAYLAEFRDHLPEIYGVLAKQLPSMPAKAARWDDEMGENAVFLEPERGAADMLTGAGVFYRRVAEAHRAGPEADIIQVLKAFVATAG
jgi:3-hydroxyisobutyrate dehydrogenase-like beta-hydroxyacid dehydrogenase